MICKTNIVLLTDCLGNITGGAEKQIFELAKRLPKDRYNVFVASMEAQGETSQSLIESIGCRLQIFRVIRIYGLSGLIQGFKFRSFLRHNSIDVLMTYHFGSDIWGTFWGHLAGVPLIISNRRDMGFWRNKSHVMTYKLIKPWVNIIVGVTLSIKEMVMKTEQVCEDKVKVIYNGVDHQQKPVDVTKKRREIGLRPEDMVIMHAANLRPVKGHKYLIEAFAQASHNYPDIKLALIGKDELNGQLQNLAEKLKVKDKVLFLGQRTDVEELLPLSDICVLPSLSEGMSNAILEYMAYGKPVIATRVGGNPELVTDGFNGLLVEKENVDQLTEALLTLLHDKDKRTLMGQNGLLKIKTEFTMETMMAKYENMFKEIALSPCWAPRNDTIKVLHLVSSGGLFGAERVILNLSSRGKEVDSFVGALNNQHNPHLELIEEADRLGLKNVVFNSQGQFDLRTIREIRKFLVDNDIDILHTHNYKADIVGFFATRTTGTKWMATNHLWQGTDKKLRFYEMIDAFILKFAQKVVSVSNVINDDLLKKGLNKDRLQVIDNGIPLENFSRKFPVDQIRAEFGEKPNERAVLIAGRLSVEKGHDIFLKAAARVIDKSKDVKFIIVGDGPLSENLKQLTKDLKLSDYTVFTGIRKDMPAIYASCDIMVNSSYNEGLPMTILEAMASHLPIIATNVGGVGKVIKNQENGILLEPGNAETLADAILELTGNGQKRKEFAQKAYQLVCERYSDQRMADQYQQIYTQL